MIRIALIEDNKALRENYKDYLTMSGNFEVIWDFDSIEDALSENVAEPNVLLLDINLPGLSAVEGFPQLKKKFAKAYIIILTAFDSSNYVKDLLKLGAHGYLLKSMRMTEIQGAIESVLEGGFSIAPIAAKHLVNEFKYDPLEELRSQLTKREFELVKLLAEGLTYNEAAERLFVTNFTINQHLKNIYIKLGINSKAELISKLIK